SGANEILQQLGVFAGEDFGFNAQLGDLFLAVHLDGDHSAAGRSFDVDGVHLFLQVLLHLAALRQQLLKRSDFHHDSSPRPLTSTIFPPKRSIIARTIGSCSKRARSSRVFCPARTVLSKTGAASSLTHTRRGLPKTALAIVRNFSMDSRDCNISES